MNSLLSEHELSLLDECYREIFNDRDCGRPEEITELGVTALIGKGIDAWNKWRSDYPSHKKIQLSNLQPNFRFLNDFSIFNFSKEVSFSNFHFKEKVSFEGVEFLQNVDFEGCVFYDDVNFHYVKFKGNVKFNGVVINPKSKFNFTEVIFKGNVDFSSVDFELWKVQRTRNESREYRDNYFMDIVSANLSSEMFPEIDFSKSISSVPTFSH